MKISTSLSLLTVFWIVVAIGMFYLSEFTVQAFSMKCFSIATDFQNKGLLKEEADVDRVREILFSSAQKSWYFFFQSQIAVALLAIAMLLSFFLGLKSKIGDVKRSGSEFEVK